MVDCKEPYYHAPASRRAALKPVGYTGQVHDNTQIPQLFPGQRGAKKKRKEKKKQVTDIKRDDRILRRNVYRYTNIQVRYKFDIRCSTNL